MAFDVLYLAMPRRGRQVLALITAVIMIAVMAWSYMPTWDVIMESRLTQLKKIQTLSNPINGERIAVRWLFASYILLMTAVIIRYIWRLYTVVKFGPPGTELDEYLSTDKNARSENTHEH